MKETGKFEQNLKRLEEIVAKMERDDQNLEETITLFQEGMLLGKECKTILSDIELKVSKVLDALDDEDSVETESIDEQF